MALLELYVRSPHGVLVDLINKTSVRTPFRITIDESEKSAYETLLFFYKLTDYIFSPAPPPPAYHPRPPGIILADGISATRYDAGQNLNPYKAVRVAGDEMLYYADNTDPTTYFGLLGITYLGCNSGDMAKPVTYGIVENPDWNWDITVPVYLSTNGDLTQSVTSGASIIVGYPIHSTTLFVNPGAYIGTSNTSGWIGESAQTKTIYPDYKVAIGTASADVSSIVHIESTSKGLLIPRMTNIEMNSIASPAEGLTIYNTTKSEFYTYKNINSGWTTSSYYQLIQKEGIPYTKRPILNILGPSITVTDNAVNQSTDIRVNQTPFTSTQLVGSGRRIVATLPLTGTGDLSSDRTIGLAGLTSIGTANSLVGVDSAGSQWEYKTLIAGTNIVLEHTAGAIRITSTGSGDERVKVTSSDTTTGYLSDKLIGSNYFSFSTESPSGNEQRKIDLNINNSPVDGYVLKWNDSLTKMEWGASSSGVSEFIQLTDVPASYTGQEGKIVRVKSDATGLEFVEGGGPMPAPHIEHAPGSILIFPIIKSSASDPTNLNTRVWISNQGPYSVRMLVFFIDGSTGYLSASYIRLTEKQVMTFLASDMAPDLTGFLIAICIDEDGYPIDNNYLIGSAAVKITGYGSCSVQAYTIRALRSLTYSTGVESVNLNFDGVDYEFLPSTLLANDIASYTDNNRGLVILNNIAGSLQGRLTPWGTDTLEKKVYEMIGIEHSQFWGSLSGPQLYKTLADADIPLFTTYIPTGEIGSISFASSDLTKGLIGAVLNYNADSNAGSFSGGSLLQVSDYLTTPISITFPIINPAS
jgi:hypothetical protein